MRYFKIATRTANLNALLPSSSSRYHSKGRQHCLSLLWRQDNPIQCQRPTPRNIHHIEVLPRRRRLTRLSFRHHEETLRLGGNNSRRTQRRRKLQVREIIFCAWLIRKNVCLRDRSQVTNFAPSLLSDLRTARVTTLCARDVLGVWSIVCTVVSSVLFELTEDSFVLEPITDHSS